MVKHPNPAGIDLRGAEGSADIADHTNRSREAFWGDYIPFYSYQCRLLSHLLSLCPVERGPHIARSETKPSLSIAVAAVQSIAA